MPLTRRQRQWWARRLTNYLLGLQGELFSQKVSNRFGGVLQVPARKVVVAIKRTDEGIYQLEFAKNGYKATYEVSELVKRAPRLRRQMLVCWAGWSETGVLKMYFIVRTPNPTPPEPHTPEVVEVGDCGGSHVEGEPEFVGTTSRWCYWVVSLPAKKGAVQTLLFGIGPKCGSDPRLNACTAAEVNKALCEWLEFRYERG